MEKWVLALIAILLTTMLPCIRTETTQALASNDLGILPKMQRKDTYMLCLCEYCPLTGPNAWDIPNQNRCNVYCSEASISMIASYYGGNLSQDRICYFIRREVYKHPPEEDLYEGMSADMITIALRWALNNVSIEHRIGKPTLDQIKNLIDSGRPIMYDYAAHVYVIDGYDDGYIHVNDPWTGTELRAVYEYMGMYNIWISPSNATARSDEPELWMDSDNDGIVDFDETRRFFTDPYSNDTDKDGIPDKTEIRSYTFLSNDTFDSEDIRKPDADNDGLRAELDPDSDNGGCPDGLEDLDRDGRLDPGETDPFNASDDPYFPPPVAKFEYSPEKPSANETITFDASESHSPKGSITSYEWNFGDNNKTTVTQPLINHTYTKPGKYVVNLEVTDNNTLWNTISKIITVYYRTDVNKDGKVSIEDVFEFAKAYGSHGPDIPNIGDLPSKNWNAAADINKDGYVNILDVFELAKEFGKTT